MSRKQKIRIGVATISVLAVAAAALVVSNGILGAKPIIPDDRLAEVTRGDLALSVVATGSVVPVATVEVKSKASGLVKEILCEEGDIVQSGQVLVELDKELLEALLREAEANLAATYARQQEAESDRLSASSMKQKLSMDLKNMDDKVGYLEKQVARFGSLFDEKLIPLSELDQREREYQESIYQRESLKSELLVQDAKIDSAAKAVSKVKAEVSQAEAARDRAIENLHNATIRSPVKATVLKRHVEVGNAVSSILQLGSQATLMLTLGDMKEVFFEGRVDETDIGKVFVGQEARVKVDAFRNQPFPGQVTRIAPLGEEKDNVIGFEVRVAIQDPKGILRAQMSANAEIIVEEKKNILIIPESAVVYDRDQKTYADVYAPDSENLKQRTEITIGISNGTSTELMEGLQEGSRVVRNDSGGII